MPQSINLKIQANIHQREHIEFGKEKPKYLLIKQKKGQSQCKNSQNTDVIALLISISFFLYSNLDCD